MKTNKFWSILMMFVFVLGSTVVFSSCSKDDDEKKEDIESAESKSKIIGTWQSVKGTAPGLSYDFDENNDIEYIVFKEGGEFYDVDIAENSVTVSKGVWTQTSKGFTYKYTNSTDKDMLSVVSNITFEFQMVEFTSNKFVCYLTLTGESVKTEMKRVPDSVAEGYIKKAAL